MHQLSRFTAFWVSNVNFKVPNWTSRDSRLSLSVCVRRHSKTCAVKLNGNKIIFHLLMTYRIALMLLMCVCIKAASGFFSSARWNCATFVINRGIHSSCACVDDSAKEVVDRKISEEDANWLAIELWIDSLITALFLVSEMDHDHSHHGHHNHGVEASSVMPTTNMQQVDPHAGHVHPMPDTGESSTMNHAMHHMMSMAVSIRRHSCGKYSKLKYF